MYAVHTLEFCKTPYQHNAALKGLLIMQFDERWQKRAAEVAKLDKKLCYVGQIDFAKGQCKVGLQVGLLLIQDCSLKCQGRACYEAKARLPPLTYNIPFVWLVLGNLRINKRILGVRKL